MHITLATTFGKLVKVWATPDAFLAALCIRKVTILVNTSNVCSSFVDVGLRRHHLGCRQPRVPEVYGAIRALHLMPDSDVGATIIGLYTKKSIGHIIM